MSEKSQHFLEQLREAVATDQLKLPSLPDVALHIRKALESETGSAQQIADILSQDPSLATRLLQLANSPLYRARAMRIMWTSYRWPYGRRVMKTETKPTCQLLRSGAWDWMTH